MKRKLFGQKRVSMISSLSLFYIALGSYSITYIPNPFLNGFPIAFNMTVIVFAGIVFGKKTGFFVGICGSILAIIFALFLKPDTPSYLYAISNMIPHALMGYSAGVISEKYNIFLGSLTIIIGHILNIFNFILIGLFSISQINGVFWQSIAFETLVDIIAINMVCMIFLISFPFIKKKW